MSKHLIFISVLLAITMMVIGTIYLVSDTAAADGPEQWTLPDELREASGLALVEGQLVSHNDEHGVVYRIDLKNRSVAVFATIGNPVIDADFEGIAFDGSSLFLVTSTGIIYQLADITSSAAKDNLVPLIFDTGLEAACEIEGLAFVDSKLLLPCKVPYIDEYKNNLVIFSFSIENQETSVYLSIPSAEIEHAGKLRPTAIDVDESSFYIVSERRLIVIDRVDHTSRVYKLPKKYHKQPEGIAILEDASIVLVDDNSKASAGLTHYQRLSDIEEQTASQQE